MGSEKYTGPGRRVMVQALHSPHTTDNPELLLRQLSAYSLDYNALTRDIFDWTPRPWQRDVLLNPNRNRILATHRQAGKSETCCALAAATTLSPLIPASTSLVVSTGRDHATDLMRRISHDLKLAQDAGLTRITEQSKHHIVLECGSRCFSVASTETATRGYSVSGVLLIDEAAFTPDAILTALFPVVAAAGGSVAIMSTPQGKSGIFSDIYHSDDDSWDRITVKASDLECCLDPAFLRQQERVLGAARYAQEYEVSFVENDLAAFSYDSIQQAFSSPDGTPWEMEQDKVIHTDNPFAGAF